VVDRGKNKVEIKRVVLCQVDEAMQEFASRCCQHNAAQPPATACIMNADGVYLATYAALMLNLRQRRANYYSRNEVSTNLNVLYALFFLFSQNNSTHKCKSFNFVSLKYIEF
jgi:hypothetical protein